MSTARHNLPARYAAALMGASALLLGVLAAAAVPSGHAQHAKKAAHHTAAAKTAARTGEQTWSARCASCHGARGEGTKAYNKPLTGTRSVAQLAQFISASMPPGPNKCKGADAQKVAAYIYDAFYSPLAQARVRPARVELSRLTVGQYRNAVADLIGSFRAPCPPSLFDQHGLHAEYYKTHGFGDRVLERVDPEVHFDYGKGDPIPAQPDPYQFSMRWEGSVIAPDTGEYEFVVRTEHAAQLWVNDLRKPLIDALVKSGSDNVYRATIYLLGGRAYPLRLDFTKGVQGVDNLAEVKKKPPAPASISLEWRMPGRPEQVVPTRCLSPVQAPETFAVSTPFPPDDRSLGYERANSVSKEWDDAIANAAIETAGYVSTNLRDLTGVKDNAPDRAAKLRDWCRAFVERAFRRPLADDVARLYVDRQFQRAPDPNTAVKRVVLLALQSPRFLYRGLDEAKPDPYDVASRLSFALWDAPPDAELMKAAAAGQLATREQVEKQAERLAADPRAWYKLRGFLLQWLKVDEAPDMVKNAKVYPGFDASTAADLRASLDVYLHSVAWSDRSDYRELMLSDTLYLNGRLAKLYDAKLPPDAPFTAVKPDGDARCGVLTQPYILASFAYADSSDPIHRGVLITRNLLGRILSPPPAAFPPLPANKHPDMTTRQRVAFQTKPATCQACHGVINPLGFTLERFDGIGRLRSEDNGKPVDSSGTYRDRAGHLVRFSGARDLASYLANSDEARNAFVQRLFQSLIRQPVRAYGSRALPDLERAFAANQFSIRKEMVEIATTAALPPSAAAPPPEQAARAGGHVASVVQ